MKDLQSGEAFITAELVKSWAVELTNRHYINVESDSTVHVTHENLMTLMSLVSQHLTLNTTL